jgi:cyclopropane-fatty-acyl-phospholipid synthase
MFSLLDVLLRRVVRHGDLTVIDAQGTARRYGDGSGQDVVVRLRDRPLERQLVGDPQLVLGEAYMDGRLVVERGRIYDLLAVVFANARLEDMPTWTQGLDALRYLARRLYQFNPSRRAARNAAHHYDINGEIYELFLDSDRQYSCGYFTPGADLETAQLAKKRHLATKLAIEPGQSVLDIGSGWGGLGLYLARQLGCTVTGVTLSTEQLKVSRERAQREGLAGSVSFEYSDYRTIAGRFDRVVSVGMFEHVGVNHYRTYFRKVQSLLKEDGVALIHTIGRSGPPTMTSPFIAKYIFPGGYIPALSEVATAIEKVGLIITDIEILRLHYAHTLRAWRERFLANWERAAALLDERFCRMWEFYLASSETAFRYGGLVVFQVQLARRVEALPLTRDYMHDSELRLAHEEIEDRRPRMAGE